MQVSSIVHVEIPNSDAQPLQNVNSKTPTVCVLTPCYNAEATIAKTLESLLALEFHGTLQIIVINDGSTDNSANIVTDFVERHPNQILLLEKPNGGEASALNLGWRESASEFIAIVEADVTVEPDWLKNLLLTLDQEPQAIAAGGYLQTELDAPWISRLAGYEVELKLQSLQSPEAKHLTSANVLYRNQAFEIAGPFDENLINASLDAVFNARLRNGGRTLLFNSRALARHKYKTSLPAYLARHFAYARFRRASSATLYPRDRLLMVQVLGTCLSVVLGFGLGLADPRWLTLLVLGPITLHCIDLIHMANRRDPALLLFPLVATLRNYVALFGLFLALLRPIQIEPRSKSKSLP